MRRLFVGATALACASVAMAKPMFGAPPAFEVYSVDAKGGGWVIHRSPARGNTLWGCKDLASVDECTQVYFNDWKTGTKLEFIHITESSQDAWLKLAAPGMPEVLLACKDPEGAPACSVVELDLQPALSTVERIWPDYECDATCDGDGGLVEGKDTPASKIESKGKADFWLQMKVRGPGPVNLYACTGLGGEPKCELTVPNWLAFDRENIGFKKLEDIETEGPDGEVVYGPGVRVGKMDEESVAAEAGFREGDVILQVGEFPVNRAKHARYLMLQYPAEDGYMLTKGDGSTVEMKGRRKPKKK